MVSWKIMLSSHEYNKNLKRISPSVLLLYQKINTLQGFNCGSKDD